VMSYTAAQAQARGRAQGDAPARIRREAAPCAADAGCRVLAFTVPGKPVPLARARAGRGGGFYTPQRSKDYKRTVAGHFLALGYGAVRHKGDVEVSLVIYRDRVDVGLRLLATVSKRRRGDVDNVAKGILDALNQLAWEDDRQVTRLDVRLAEGKEESK